MRWSLLNPNQNTVSSVKKAFRTSEVIAKVLANRNILNPNLARPFFTPNLDMLHNPYLMQDMDKAVERVLKNIKSGKPIMVFGDYDVDGTTGAAALYLAFQKFGADVTYYIPDREKEGYGLSYHGIEVAKDIGIDLIITCDCGINAFVQVDFANEQNINIIITDHHTTDTELPKAHAILNPKREDCEYPFKGLCGGGVAFKLITAVGNELNIPLTDYEEIIPLITLGIAADVVPIKDENRVLVHHGLNILKNLEKPTLGSDTEIGLVLHEMAERIKKRGLVILISDLMDDQETVLSGLKHFRHNKQEVILFHILDRKELDFEFNTRTRFKDMESGSFLTTEPWQIKSSYKKRIQHLQNDYKKQCREQLIDYVPLFTDQSLDIALNGYLNKRQKLG